MVGKSINPSTFEQRIRYVQDLIGTTDLAAMTGVSTSQLNRYSNGESKPTLEKVEAIANAAGINLVWLITGEGTATGEAIQHKSGMGNFCLVDTPHNTTPNDIAFSDGFLYALQTDKQQAIRLNMPDDSMTPRFQQGDLLLADQGFQKSNGIYLIKVNDVVMVRRLSYEFDGSIELIADSSSYKNVTLAPEQQNNLNVLAKVVWHGSKL